MLNKPAQVKYSNVFATIVTYNPELTLLDRQIDSLLNQVNGIVIVDNFSKNLDMLKNYLSEKKIEQKITFHVIFNKKNMGLGAAQNQGIRLSISSSATDIILLDQDSVLEENFMQNILNDRQELIDQGNKVGAIGPVYYSEVTNQVYPITKFKGPFIERIEPTDFPAEASFLIASGCLINVEVLNEVGLMNEELFIDCIDVDWSFRASGKGYKLFASPKTKMMHTIGDNRMDVMGRSISVHSPLRRYYLFRNSIYMIRSKNIPVGYKLREITFNTLRLLIFLSVSKERSKYLKYSFAGFKDGIRGIWGECAHKF